MPNMGGFFQRVNDMLGCDGKVKDCIIMRADLSHFKHINDTYGFDVGDKVISMFYEMFQCAAGAFTEEMVLARTHGDEFILFTFGDQNKALDIARRLIGELETLDLEKAGVPSKFLCYVGIVLAKTSRKKWRDVLDYSHEALSQARKKGANSYEVLIFPE